MPRCDPISCSALWSLPFVGGSIGILSLSRSSLATPIISLLTVLENGDAIETANIGREGAFGLLAAMYSRVSFNRCLLQMAGPMVRCKTEALESEFKHSDHVRNLFVSYSETLLSQVQQTVACNALHTVEERMCRWLLMMHDRAEGAHMAWKKIPTGKAIKRRMARSWQLRAAALIIPSARLETTGEVEAYAAACTDPRRDLRMAAGLLGSSWTVTILAAIFGRVISTG